MLAAAVLSNDDDGGVGGSAWKTKLAIDFVFVYRRFLVCLFFFVPKFDLLLGC